MTLLEHLPTFRALGRLLLRVARPCLGEQPLYLLPSLPCLLWASLLGGALAGDAGLSSYGFFLSTPLLPWFVLSFILAMLLLVAGLGASHRLLGRQTSLWVATLASVPALMPQAIFFLGLHPAPALEIFWSRYRTALQIEWPGTVLSTKLFGSDLHWLRLAIVEGAQPPVGFAVAETALSVSTNLVVWYLIGAAGIRVAQGIARWWKKF